MGDSILFTRSGQPQGERFTTRENLLDVTLSFKARGGIRRDDTYKLTCQGQRRLGEPDFTYCSPEQEGQAGLELGVQAGVTAVV